MSAKTFSSSIELEQLLSPVSPARPAGEYLLYEGTYDLIRAARHEDNPELSQGIYKTDLKRANWEEVERICLEALENRSKDLQIASWLLEAWMHRSGFAGVRDGLRLLAGLCLSFWENLHPEIEEGDPDARISPIVWINEKLSIEIKKIPITSPQSGDLPNYSFADWESACYLDNQTNRNPGAAQPVDTSGKATLANFQASAMLSEQGFYVALFEDLSGTMEACLVLEQILDERFGKYSPSLIRLKETLEMIQRLAGDILRARGDNVPYLSEERRELPAVALEQEQESALWTGSPIRSRAEAYQRLSEAADYLLRTEPHSPTPYLVRRAVAWGSMSLLEIYQQIIRNEGEMDEINRLLRLANLKEGTGSDG